MGLSTWDGAKGSKLSRPSSAADVLRKALEAPEKALQGNADKVPASSRGIQREIKYPPEEEKIKNETF